VVRCRPTKCIELLRSSGSAVKRILSCPLFLRYWNSGRVVETPSVAVTNLFQDSLVSSVNVHKTRGTKCSCVVNLCLIELKNSSKL
jgi:hypothetical protein